MAEYYGASHDGGCSKGVTDAITLELAEMVPSTNIAKRPDPVFFVSGRGETAEAYGETDAKP